MLLITSPHTCLTYVTEQIWMLHCKYDSHSHYAKWTYRSTFFYISTKIQQTSTNTSQITKCVPEKICPSNTTYMPHMPNTFCADIRQLCQYINLIWTQIYQHNAVKSVTPNTAILTFHIIGICPCTNMPYTMHM